MNIYRVKTENTQTYRIILAIFPNFSDLSKNYGSVLDCLCVMQIQEMFFSLFRPEINIEPWEVLSKGIAKGNKRRSWMEKEPFAYWKGNPTVNPRRKDLLRCNVSPQQDWNARVYAHVCRYNEFKLVNLGMQFVRVTQIKFNMKQI